MIRLFFLIFLTVVSLGTPSIIHSAPPEDIVEDEEDDDEELEDEDIDDWDSDIEDDYVPVGADGSIPSIETPSIIDSGIYTNVIEIDMEDVEDHGIDTISLPNK